MDAAHRLDGQGGDMIDVALHEPLEAISNPDDVDAFEPRADRRRRDDTVDTGGGSAADKNGQPLMMFHSLRSYKLSGRLCRYCACEHQTTARRHRRPVGQTRARRRWPADLPLVPRPGRAAAAHVLRRGMRARMEDPQQPVVRAARGEEARQGDLPPVWA